MNKISGCFTVLLVLFSAGCGEVGVKYVAAASKDTSSATMVAERQKQETKTIEVPENSPIRSRLVVDTPRVDQVSAKFSAPASVEADPSRFARIYPPLSGRVTKLNVRLGDSVTEGQELGRMDSPDFAEAQGDCQHAKTALVLAEKTLKRVLSLFEHGVAAQKEVEQAQADYDAAKIDVERTQNRLGQYTPTSTRQCGEPIAIKSPIAGRVVELSASKGEFRNDPAASMMTIADLSTVWLTADVQEKDARFVRKGGEVTAVLAAYPEETFRGEVLFVGDMLSVETRSLKVHIAFPNPEGRLKPGMFATASFIGDSASATTIPTTAIFQMDGASRVYVEVAPWLFEPREIKLGAQEGERAVVLAGLDSSERIVVQEGSLLR